MSTRKGAAGPGNMDLAGDLQRTFLWGGGDDIQPRVDHSTDEDRERGASLSRHWLQQEQGGGVTGAGHGLEGGLFITAEEICCICTR